MRIIISSQHLVGREKLITMGDMKNVTLATKMWIINELFKEIGLSNVGVRISRGKESYVDLQDERLKKQYWQH